MNRRGVSVLLAILGAALLTWGLLGFVASHWGTVWVGHYDNGLSYDIVSRSLAAVGAAVFVAGWFLHKDAK